MNWNQLQYVITIAEEKSITKLPFQLGMRVEGRNCPFIEKGACIGKLHLATVPFKKRRTSLPLPKFICLRYLQFHLFCFQRITISERSAARSARLPLSIRISAASVPAVILPFLLQDEGWVLRFFRKFMHEQLPFRIFISSPRITFMTPGTSVLSIGKIFIITHSSRRFLLSSARSSRQSTG